MAVTCVLLTKCSLIAPRASQTQMTVRCKSALRLDLAHLPATVRFTESVTARLPYQASERTVPGRWTLAGAAIHSRSSGLLDFVQAYRSFANLPAPFLTDVGVPALFERVRTLMSQEIEAWTWNRSGVPG